MRFSAAARGPFDFEQSRRWLEGWPPGGVLATSGDHLHLAFPVEGDWEPVGLCLQGAEHSLTGETAGDGVPDGVQAQVERIFSLDVDGSSWPQVGRRDPVIASLQDAYPGLRPVCFASPYEAAVWAILSQRVRMSQAARAKERMAKELGTALEVHGELVHAFPSPARLLEVRSFPGVMARKVGRLNLVAGAALDGILDAARLRAMPAEQAIADVKRIPGIGDFSAELIVVRGAGAPDVFPTRERRLLTMMTELYALGSDAPLESMERIADKWRPFRSWAAVLIRTELERRRR
ncbi:DNA-3-methyladenine glycosylase [soil metagenome]